MNYLFHYHHTLQSPEGARTSGAPLVLLAETEPEALALYARHLAQVRLLVNVCLDLSQLARQAAEIRPQLLVINPTSDLSAAIAVLRQVMTAQPGLPVITVGSAIPDSYLDRLMASGVVLHINRNLSQPRDVAVAARQILGLT
jgi:hypothetical protein